MKINFAKPLLSVKKESLKIDPSTDATLRWAAVEALLGQVQGETLTPTQKVNRFKLAQKIEDADETTDFTIEEVAQTKEAIGKFFPVPVTGASYEIIEAC